MTGYDYDYDLVTIGSGPAAHGAAIQAAKLGKRVAVIERYREIGGDDVNAGSASKTLREATLYLTGYREQSTYGDSYAVKQNVTMSDLLVRTSHVMEEQTHVLRRQLARNRIEIITAHGSFVDPHTIRLSTDDDNASRTITAEKVIIAVGTSSTPPPRLYADGRLIFVSDDVLKLSDVPRTLTIIGAGAIGLEYCSNFAVLGSRVTLVDRGPQLLPFADQELVETLAYHLRQSGVTLRMNEEVLDIEYFKDRRGDRVRVIFSSGKQLVSDAVMYCVGRTGNTRSLELQAIGIEPDERGRLQVDDNYETPVSSVYAVGGVVGFPDLVSTSRMQGRLAVCHAFGVDTNLSPRSFPYSVRTIPEVAMVGMTESELTDQGIPYEVGKAVYRETVNSIIKGYEVGFLKLLFDIETRKVLGVHILGEGAAELIHIGQAVIALGGTIDYFEETVISYPSLAECYMTAALNGLGRLSGSG